MDCRSHTVLRTSARVLVSAKQGREMVVLSTSFQRNLEFLPIRIPCNVLVDHERCKRSIGSSWLNISCRTSNGISVMSLKRPLLPRIRLWPPRIKGFMWADTSELHPSTRRRLERQFGLPSCSWYPRFTGPSSVSGLSSRGDEYICSCLGVVGSMIEANALKGVNKGGERA